MTQKMRVYWPKYVQPFFTLPHAFTTLKWLWVLFQEFDPGRLSALPLVGRGRRRRRNREQTDFLKFKIMRTF